jgi:hypothetical protein
VCVLVFMWFLCCVSFFNVVFVLWCEEDADPSELLRPGWTDMVYVC